MDSMQDASMSSEDTQGPILCVMCSKTFSKAVLLAHVKSHSPAFTLTGLAQLHGRASAL